MTNAEALELLNRDGNLAVPCSRYGHDTESCAPIAVELANIVAYHTGTELDEDALDYAMGLVVNDHDDVESLIRDYGNAELLKD